MKLWGYQLGGLVTFAAVWLPNLQFKQLSQKREIFWRANLVFCWGYWWFGPIFWIVVLSSKCLDFCQSLARVAVWTRVAPVLSNAVETSDGHDSGLPPVANFGEVGCCCQDKEVVISGLPDHYLVMDCMRIRGCFRKTKDCANLSHHFLFWKLNFSAGPFFLHLAC